jgi:LmbE family N-acetylglucosaminyl deacetylase
VELVVDDVHPGTDERTWLGSERLRNVVSLCVAPPRRLVVIAPHPDDEVLGAGGLVHSMRQLGVEVAIVAVTDGEASHPVARARGVDVASTRALESVVALERLGCGQVPVARLRLPDGKVAAEIPHLTALLEGLLRPHDLCLGPWRRDGHPDHDAVGTATRTAARATGSSVLEYLVWTWHWATPDTAAIPWRNCRRFDLGRRLAARKRWATYAFTSQIRPRHSEPRHGPVLTDSVLRRFWRPFEVFFEAAG